MSGIDRASLDGSPRLGALVVFVAPHPNAISYDQAGRGVRRAALISQAAPDAGQLWRPGLVNLTVFDGPGPRVVVGVPHSPEPRIGHWSWPPP